MRSLKLVIPLAAFVAIAAFLAIGLTRDPREVPSPLIDKAAPNFRIAQSGLAPVVGLNYKDARDDALPWLERNGNPYQLIVFDASGRIGIDYGVYGVPETFVIDKQGVIRYKQIGPITPEALEQTILPLIRKLEA